MTYTFPPSLHPLRDYLKRRGFYGDAVKTSRQAAFIAQQLLNTRVKFPAKGKDMVPTLTAIQQGMIDKAVGALSPVKKQPKQTQQKWEKRKRAQRVIAEFSEEMFAAGIHIFCDGASVPNPGVGGWGVVVYREGAEIGSQYGGDPQTTNNIMEMTALLVSIEKAQQLSALSENPTVIIWSDSKYVVDGVNTWMPAWKANGWNKRKLNSPKRDEGGIKNLELWQAIDEALSSMQKQHIAIRWVKGHAGIAGNERADELAEIGRQAAAANYANSHSIGGHDADLHHEGFQVLPAQFKAIVG